MRRHIVVLYVCSICLTILTYLMRELMLTMQNPAWGSLYCMYFMVALSWFGTVFSHLYGPKDGPPR